MANPPRRRARLNDPNVFPLVSETHAAAIGYVAIQWSAVEGALAGLVGHLLKIEGPAARALTDDRSAFAILNMATVLINLSGDTQAISEWGSLSAAMKHFAHSVTTRCTPSGKFLEAII
jgi:hypothetical protein